MARSLTSNPMRKSIHLTSEAYEYNECTWEYGHPMTKERQYFNK